MLTNGFFARLIIVDIGKRGEGQTPGSVRQLPEPVIEAAKWWAEFQPGTQRANLLEVLRRHPAPEGLQMARSLLKNQELKDAAQSTVTAITKAIGTGER